jgi:hypothetical protein
MLQLRPPSIGDLWAADSNSPATGQDNAIDIGRSFKYAVSPKNLVAFDF